ncbi:Protein kinase, membrane associated tyrosine threonine 1 [Geranomyces michiganensis]|nr:Protein kinase, membrane associated tyrosine threonine 1 [Geranomyces michiganensis]
MDDVVVFAETPPRKSTPVSLTPPSARSHASSAADFSGHFRIPQAPQRQLPSSIPTGAARDTVPPLKSLNKPLMFATPAPPKRRSAGSHIPLRPSALPRPIRSTRSSFNLSSLSDSMDGNEDDASSQSTPSEASQPSPWSAFGTPDTPVARIASQNSARHSTLFGRNLTETPSAGPAFESGGDSADQQTPTTKLPHERLDSTYSEPDILQADRFGSTFFTPQQKLVKPNPAAFHSTGLLSRKGRPLVAEHQTFTMPETPLKKGSTPALAFNRRGEGFAPKALAPAAALETEKSHGAGVHPDHLEQNFRITERLGRGSFAEAFKVQSKIDGRYYAIKKTIHPFTGFKDGLNKMSEVEVLWQIGSHPYCVGLVAAWVQYGYMYLQMELCEAGSLDAYLEDNCRDSSLEEYRIWHILAEIAQSLKHIQDLGLVHLDLKPANIFITRSGALKIGDYGLASRAPVSNLDDREGDRTYIAPEIMKAPSFGKPADIFSLGLIILEITANVILPENGPYWHKLREGDLGEIDFGQEISPALVDLVKSMLDPDPDMRPTVDGILGHPYVAQVCAAHAPLGALSVVDPEAGGL